MNDARTGSPAAELRSPATELRESMRALTRQMRRHRPDHGLTLSQLEVLAEVSRTGVSTPAEVAVRLHVRVQSLTESINELVAHHLVSRRADTDDRRRQFIEITPAGIALLEYDRGERDAWLNANMRENLSQLEFDLVMLVAPVLRKLAYGGADRPLPCTSGKGESMLEARTAGSPS
jgi:DNA-binding MarR family transcriptional regulator